MKKLISVLLAALMLLSSVTVVMADASTEEYELYMGTDPSAYELKFTSFPAVSGIHNYTIYSDKLELPANTAVGTTGYGCFMLRKENGSSYDPVNLADVLNGDNIYDYELQIELARCTNTNYVTDVEIGLGNYQAEDGDADKCTDKPSVAKTFYLGNVLGNVANGSSTTLCVDVADILANGNEQKFAVEGVEPNELDANNLNLVAIKATCSTSVTSKTNFIKVNSIKLVKKQNLGGLPADNTTKTVDLMNLNANIGTAATTAKLAATDDGTVRIGMGGTKGQVRFDANTPKDTVAYWQQPVKYGNLMASFESFLNGGKLEDYALEVTFSWGVSTDYIDDIEIGLGASSPVTPTASTADYQAKSTSVKMVSLISNEEYTAMGGKTAVKTISIPVKEILTAGTPKDFGENTPELIGKNINSIVVKAKFAANPYSSALNVIKFANMKFVRKTADIAFDEESGEFNFSACDYTATPALASAKAIVAYYSDLDEDGIYNLEYCDVMPLTAQDTNNASISIPRDTGEYGGLPLIKAFMFNSMDEITPLTQALVLTN